MDVPKQTSGYHHKNTVLSLVNRTTGEARSFHVENTTVAQVIPIVMKNIHAESAVMSDTSNTYRRRPKKVFASHDMVNHMAKEYVRGHVHTNTIEGFFSILKRGMKGVYQHCSEKHLHRCLAEFDFRYNNRKAFGVEDERRSGRALAGIAGKRLTYRRTGELD